MEEPLLLRPPSTTAAAAGGGGTSVTAANILTRVSLVIFIAVVSAWAHLEASKSFGISIVNAAAGTKEGRLFDLMFVSNGAAGRIVHVAVRSMELLLRPNEPVRHVTLHVYWNDSQLSSAGGSGDDHASLVIEISADLMAAADPKSAVAEAVRRGVARSWTCSKDPPEVVDYLSGEVGSPFNDGVRSCSTARFLRFVEHRRPGFVAALNSAACAPPYQISGSRRAVAEAAEELEKFSRRLCEAYRSDLAGLAGSGDLRNGASTMQLYG